MLTFQMFYLLRHDTQHNDVQYYDTQHNILIITALSIAALNTGMRSVIMLNVIYIEGHLCRVLKMGP
jgi:hypothetical protein